MPIVTPTLALTVFGAGAVAGSLGALLGISGGVIKVPALNAWCGVPLRAAAGTSAFMLGVTRAIRRIGSADHADFYRLPNRSPGSRGSARHPAHVGVTIRYPDAPLQQATVSRSCRVRRRSIGRSPIAIPLKRRGGHLRARPSLAGRAHDSDR